MIVPSSKVDYLSDIVSSPVFCKVSQELAAYLSSGLNLVAQLGFLPHSSFCRAHSQAVF